MDYWRICAMRSRFRNILLISISLCAVFNGTCTTDAQQKVSPDSKTAAKASSSSDLAELIEIETGELPLIISAPHGGGLNIAGSVERKGMGVEKFVVVRDTYTDRLARAVADALKAKTGRKPHLVIAHFARRHADANRAAAGAYENDSAKRVYEAYHDALAKAREQILQANGRGLIIDIHGQGAEQNTIFRGTQNRSTVKTMLAKDGEAAFSGERSVLGSLVKSGYTIKPDPSLQVPEDPRYNGGYITQTYGSKNGGNIDGIQLEFGSIPRSPDQYQKTASDLANALITYMEAYLGQKLTPPQALQINRKSK